ncbi:MAG: hypothetical protein HN392_01905 [Anaerolineae bacterium]|jgi:hypothetical protein|nr:hypothetical protein [Anaerolineae bacterium]MBT7075323.1 hypothetical protein [Anaerolineae bacterium]MBT7783918.1 hypothetical protein [Anaerolineae bacterium]
MQRPSVAWTRWSDTLTRYKIKSLVAWFLEVGEPLNIVGAQILYFGEPLLGGGRFNDIARFLENEEERRAFISFLRKD